jgi:transposase-like protein
MAQVKTSAEMFPLVESWQKSGLTQKEFSQQHGVSEHVFYYWVSRYRNGQPVSPLAKKQPVAQTKPNADARTAATFIRLSSTVEAVPPAARGEAEATTVVELPSGVVLRFRGLVPVAYLKELLTCSLV